MAEYSSQAGRYYDRQPSGGHEPPAASNNQRDDAFSSIFGAAPPPGRSQTMTTSHPPPLQQRTQTMGGRPSDLPHHAPPVRQNMNGYDRTPHHSQAYQPPPPPPPPPTQNGQYHPERRGYEGQPGQAPHRQPQPQHLPQPLRPDRRAYALPHRLDTRQGPPQPMYNKPIPNRYPGGAPPTALNSDPYRSQSMAAVPRPQMHPPQGQGYGIAPGHSFRSQPTYNHMARTTAQGRVVPERPDERTMSMTSYSRDGEFSQTMSGRVIPHQPRPLSEEPEPYSGSSPVSPSVKTRSVSQSSYPSLPTRTTSMASTTVAPSERTDSMSVTKRPSLTRPNNGGQNTAMVVQRKSPLVDPAILSRVAQVFRDKINLVEKEKDGLVYKDAFTGAEAVDLIAYIIKTSDRNLALLLGRSLDAQKFFHEVTYAHRLRDSQSAIFQMKETMLEDPEVNGIYTLLTECYSPTCSRDRLCYSIACPRRLEQTARLNMKPQPGLKRQDSRASLHEDLNDEQKLWINTVPKEVVDSVSDREKKRQEVLSEIMYTERDFVKDLEYLRDFWMKPLRSPQKSPIPEHRRETFVRTVFSNCQDVYMVNSRFADALTRRQQQNHVVRNVGDIFLDYVGLFDPFITYGASQLFGKYEFEKEKASNPTFTKFVTEVERMKESRKLELNGYLTKPTTRLARYPLLLENVQKYTADDNPDKEDIPKAISRIREVLSKVNVESGKAENRFNLMQLEQQIRYRAGDVDLKLTDENRQVVFKGILKKTPTETSGDIHAFLFDHAVLLGRLKAANKAARKEELKPYRKPIPLELLVVSQIEEFMPKLGITKRPSSGLLPGTKSSAAKADPNNPKAQGYPLSFKHLGKGGYEITLFCSSQIQQRKWLEHIEAQQTRLSERGVIFNQTILNEGFFTAAIRVNCVVPIDGGRKLVIGTDIGVYVTDRKPKDASVRPKRVLDCKSVTQIDILEQHQILLVLSEKTLYTYSTETLDGEEFAGTVTNRGKKVAHANFFKAGVSTGHHLVACVKSASSSTTIKIYEPMDGNKTTKKKSSFSKMLAGGQDVLKHYKDIAIPAESSSIHFLRSKLCVGCSHGFEIFSLDNLERQPLLDQADTSLDFVVKKDHIKPIHIERMAFEFLLCYSDYSFFVDRDGWRARPDWIIQWEGRPQAFAIFNQYILAFEPSFIEIRYMDTGALAHILTAKNIRMLHSSTREILYAYEDDVGEDVIASIDFWGRPQNSPLSTRSAPPDRF